MYGNFLRRKLSEIKMSGFNCDKMKLAAVFIVLHKFEVHPWNDVKE